MLKHEIVIIFGNSKELSFIPPSVAPVKLFLDTIAAVVFPFLFSTSEFMQCPLNFFELLASF